MLNIFIDDGEEGQGVLVTFANHIGVGDAADVAECMLQESLRPHLLHSDVPLMVKCGMKNFHMENEKYPQKLKDRIARQRH